MIINLPFSALRAFEAVVCLSGFSAAPTWDFWARNCGLTLPKPAKTRCFGQSNIVVQAAIQGLGVALGRKP
ncbi:hypothetical protein [Yoonia sediminilitoris]|uniref:LysR substrate binding domain-containing protein n=1 Tax=Yoonia sediminilitoris TaxID=1286148 RepID=A0A2T6KAY3_9RHOB|nr:hypothetical protein [Yoonia sediminilitoris]PUB12039.1 hypothetical protein C8N45_11116 [Yoonia sediminilitoris]RCW92866.1 hypothetical protein DFP92_11115 [Yoonia sediminilitoris]